MKLFPSYIGLPLDCPLKSILCEYFKVKSSDQYGFFEYIRSQARGLCYVQI